MLIYRMECVVCSDVLLLLSLLVVASWEKFEEQFVRAIMKSNRYVRNMVHTLKMMISSMSFLFVVTSV